MVLTIGSWSVGWVAPNSGINSAQWLAPFRTTELGVTLGTVLLTVGAWGMIWGWLRLGRVLRRPTRAYRGKYEFAPGGMRITNWAVAIWSLPQLFALTIFSRDMLAYLNQGRQVLAGQNPYAEGISNLPNWFQLGTDTMWAEDATPYGPMFLWIEAAVVGLTGADQPDAAIFVFRLAAVGGVALIMYYVPKLAEMQGWDPARAQWISAANPLFIISFVASGHNRLADGWVHGRGHLCGLARPRSAGSAADECFDRHESHLHCAATLHRAVVGRTQRFVAESLLVLVPDPGPDRRHYAGGRLAQRLRAGLRASLPGPAPSGATGHRLVPAESCYAWRWWNWAPAMVNGSCPPSG